MPEADRTKRGATMSTKQIQQASLRGRLVGFEFYGSQPKHEVVGYVVGMDDYHWMVVAPGSIDTDIAVPATVVLVHKAKPDAVVLHSESTLSQEAEAVQKKINAIGNPYWELLKSQEKRETAVNA